MSRLLLPGHEAALGWQMCREVSEVTAATASAACGLPLAALKKLSDVEVPSEVCLGGRPAHRSHIIPRCLMTVATVTGRPGSPLWHHSAVNKTALDQISFELRVDEGTCGQISGHCQWFVGSQMQLVWQAGFYLINFVMLYLANWETTFLWWYTF